MHVHVALLEGLARRKVKIARYLSTKRSSHLTNSELTATRHLKEFQGIWPTDSVAPQPLPIYEAPRKQPGAIVSN